MRFVSLGGNRCHELQTVLIVGGSIKSHEALDTSQRKELIKILCQLWDTWKPKCINTNCGLVHKQNALHWILDFSTESLSAVVKQNQENQDKLQRALQHYFKHCLAMNEKWMKVKNMQQLEGIKGDIDLYYRLEEKIKAKSAMKQLRNDGDTKIPARVIFGNLQEINDPHCTRLYVNIATNNNHTEFKMSNCVEKVNEAIESLIDLNTISVNILREFITAITDGDYQMYRQSLEWFELGIYVLS